MSLEQHVRVCARHSRDVAGGAAALGGCLGRCVQTYDVVIEHARIVDGTGNPWFHGDVAIQGDRIARVTYAGGLANAPSKNTNRRAQSGTLARLHRYPRPIARRAAQWRRPPDLENHPGHHHRNHGRRRHQRPRQRQNPRRRERPTPSARSTRTSPDLTAFALGSKPCSSTARRPISDRSSAPPPSACTAKAWRKARPPRPSSNR